jgi:hypothetical protein
MRCLTRDQALLKGGILQLYLHGAPRRRGSELELALSSWQLCQQSQRPSFIAAMWRQLSAATSGSRCATGTPDKGTTHQQRQCGRRSSLIDQLFLKPVCSSGLRQSVLIVVVAVLVSIRSIFAWRLLPPPPLSHSFSHPPAD